MNHHQLLQPLERRRLLAATFASLNSQGTLSVAGTSKNDTITISVDHGTIIATLNSSPIEFAGSRVRQISVDGFGGNDRISNQTSRPSTLLGDSGNDTLLPGTGPDSLDGGAGENVADYTGQAHGFDFDTSGVGGDASDHGDAHDFDDIENVSTYIGTPHNDSFFYGGSSPQTVRGGGGNDTFRESDVLADGPTLLDGGSGNDTFLPRGGQSATLLGGSGDDTLALADIPARFDGGAGTDTLVVNRFTTLDLPTFETSVEQITNIGASGPQKIIGTSADELMSVVSNSHFGCTLLGNGGNDTLVGSRGADSIFGGSGDDIIIGGAGDDTLDGGAGRDQLSGQDDNDTLLAKDGRTDTLDGGHGTDTAQRDNSSTIKDLVSNVEHFI